MDSNQLRGHIDNVVSPLYKTDKAMYYAQLASAEASWRAWLFSEYAWDLSEKTREKIYSKAWEDGHSSGYYEVEHHFSELCDLVTEILKDK